MKSKEFEVEEHAARRVRMDLKSKLQQFQEY